MEWLFGKRKTLADYGREWKASIDKQKRELDRDIRAMQQSETRTQREIQAQARAGQMASARSMALELVRSRKARTRLQKVKTQMTAVQNKLTESIAMANLSGSIKKSTDLMRMMNCLVNLPQLRASMQEMSKEMQRMELISESIDDTMEMMDEDDVEEEVDEAVDEIMDELALDLHEDVSNVAVGGGGSNRVRVDLVMGNEGEQAL